MTVYFISIFIISYVSIYKLPGITCTIENQRYKMHIEEQNYSPTADMLINA